MDDPDLAYVMTRYRQAHLVRDRAGLTVARAPAPVLVLALTLTLTPTPTPTLTASSA